MKTIINADDLGYSYSINQAIFRAISLKNVSQATVMVNMPAFKDACEAAVRNDLNSSIGLHINLTEGSPISTRMKNNKKFVNSVGNFRHTNVKYFRNRLFFFNKSDLFCIIEEIESQIKLYLEKGFTLMHLDSHHHIHTNLSLIFIFILLGKKYKFKSMRISRNLMGKKESNLKKLYKVILNLIIRKSFCTVKFFGEYNSYYKYYNKTKNSDVEIMVHPDFIEGSIVDVLKKGKVYKKLNLYKYHTSELSTY